MRLKSAYGWMLAILGAVLLPWHGQAAPRIAVGNPVHDFGSLTNVPKATHNFILHNEGDTELVIDRVSLGCNSCMRTGLDKRTVTASEYAVLHCELDTRQLRGRVARSISVYSNDPVTPVLVLGLEATIVSSYRMTPPEFALGGVAGNRSAAIEIIPLLAMRRPLSLAQCDNSNVTVQVTEPSPGRFVLTVSMLESFPCGYFPVDVTVSSTDPVDPPCFVQGSVYFPPDQEVSPSQLVFAAKAEPQTRILWFRQHGGQPWRLLDVLSPPGTFYCEVDPLPGTANYRIYVTARDQHQFVGKEQNLTLKAVDKSNKERLISVPITVKPTNN